MTYRNTDYKEEKSLFEKIFSKKGITLIVTAIVLVVILLMATYTVNQGEAAVVKSWGQVTDVTTAGFHWKVPFQDSVESFNIKVRSVSLEESTGTSDLQQVTTQVTVNYEVKAENVKSVYTSFNQGVENNIIVPSIQEALKATTAKYTAE